MGSASRTSGMIREILCLIAIILGLPLLAMWILFIWFRDKVWKGDINEHS